MAAATSAFFSRDDTRGVMGATRRAAVLAKSKASPRQIGVSRADDRRRQPQLKLPKGASSKPQEDPRNDRRGNLEQISLAPSPAVARQNRLPIEVDGTVEDDERTAAREIFSLPPLEPSPTPRLRLAPSLTAAATTHRQQQSLSARAQRGAPEEREHARKALELARDLAVESYADSEWAMCDEALTSMLELEGHSSDTLYSWRSRVRLRQGRADLALADADSAIGLAPLSPRGFHRRARALCGQSKLDQAGEAYLGSLARGASGNDEGIEERFELLLGKIRREHQRLDSPTSPRYRHGVDRFRRELSYTPPPNQGKPSRCMPVELIEATPHSLRLRVRAVPDDGNDDIYKYEVQIARVDPLEPENYHADFVTVYADLDHEMATHDYEVRRRAASRGEPEAAGADGADGGRFCVLVDERIDDFEFVGRCCAYNSYGRGEWSVDAHFETLPVVPPPKVAFNAVPTSWLALERRLRDIFIEARKQPGGPRSLADGWASIKEVLLSSMTSLKVLFRFYSLSGAGDAYDANPDAMTLPKLRRLLHEAQLQDTDGTGAHGMLKLADVDLIFITANRPTPGPKRTPSSRPSSPRAARTPSKPIIAPHNDDDDSGDDSDDYDETPRPPRRFNRFGPKQTETEEPAVSSTSPRVAPAAARNRPAPTPAPAPVALPPAPAAIIRGPAADGGSGTAVESVNLLVQHEFIDFLARVAWALHKHKVPPDKAPAAALAQLLDESLAPLVERILERDSKREAALASRAARAALLLHHHDELVATYKVYARTDKYAAGGRTDAMSYAELMMLVKDTSLLDERLSVAQLTIAYLQVNLEDEIYVQADKGDVAGQLTYEEFAEFITRVGYEKTVVALSSLPQDDEDAPPPDKVPFGKALYMWLTLEFMPRARQARKQHMLG